MHGFFGRLLYVDLDEGTGVFHDIEATRLRRCLGGIGLGASLLFEYAAPGVDPLSPAAPLVFTSAPLAGTGLTTTAKFAVVAKSPLTGFIADSLSSSHFGLELKRIGVDALIVTGKASSLSYLFIDRSSVQVGSAEHLRSATPAETESRLRARLGGHVWVASIGTAGEHLVRFATISNGGRHAGRGGVGAVMGAKNLKAIALSGDRATPVADPTRVDAISRALRRRSTGSVTDKYRTIGTVANVAVFNRFGTLPTRNFQQPTFDDADAVSGERLADTHFARRHGCASCTIRCERLFTPGNGDGREQRLEYETLFALGPLCGIGDPDVVIEAARLCDAYGLDAISTGGTLAWAMESASRGLLPGAAAVGLRFGDGAGLLAGIRAIGEREGVGALLGEGSRRAAMEVGGGSSDWAMHVKGLELPGYEPRSLKTMALGLAVSPRGACHNRSGAYEADFSGQVDRFKGDAGRGPLVAASEDYAAVMDSLIVCKFLRRCFADFYADAAEILQAVTGWDYTADELRVTGERIHTSKKLFNVREGWQPDADWLPARVLGEKLPTGIGAGIGLTPEELRAMLAGYYSARGWTADGFVPAQKLADLGLDAPLGRVPRTRQPARLS